MVPAQGGVPGLKDRSRLLADEAPPEQGLTPGLLHPLRVVDGGKARIILNALVRPFELTENQPMLDLLWRTSFRWQIHPRQLTGETAYGPVENIAAVERAGIRAYVPLTGAGKACPYFRAWRSFSTIPQMTRIYAPLDRGCAAFPSTPPAPSPTTRPMALPARPALCVRNVQRKQEERPGGPALL